MPYVTTREMLIRARDGGYAVPAFNAENLEMLKGILLAAETARSPVIIQAGEKTLDFIGFEPFSAAIKKACESATIPAALHLDHGTSLIPAARALKAGFSSVMVDSSRFPYEENVHTTRAAVELCEACGVPVEGELGCIGGKEDDIQANVDYTDPAQAADYEARTGVSSLAVAIGTAHGVYKIAPRLGLTRLSAIRERTKVPLVLHGSSGLSDESVAQCVRRGISKVNFATELRQAYTAAMLNYLSRNPGQFDLRLYEAPAIEAVRTVCLHRIEVCQSKGRA